MAGDDFVTRGLKKLIKKLAPLAKLARINLASLLRYVSAAFVSGDISTIPMLKIHSDRPKSVK